MSETTEPTETPTADVTSDTSPSSTPAPAQPDVSPAAAPPTDSSAAPVEPIWREDWREKLAGNDEKALQQLRRYQSPEGIWKKARELEKRMSSGEFRRAMPDGTNEEALAAWRQEMGVPNVPEDYVDALPEDITIDQEDVPALSRIFEKMHAMGVPAEQAAAIVNEYYQTVNETQAETLQADHTYRNEAEDTLRAEWGPRDYRPTVDAIGQLVREYGGDELVGALMNARTADGRLLGDNPQVLKFLAGIAREIYPDGFIPLTPTGGLSATGDTVAQELQKLEFEMGDTRGRAADGYWNNPTKQERYRALLDAQEKLARRGR